MKCPTCNGDLVLIRTVTQDETLMLNDDGLDVEVLTTDVLHVDVERLVCVSNEQEHMFAAEWDDDAMVYRFAERV